MNTFFQFLNAEFIYASGWTILHSFWQCALVAALLAITLSVGKNLSSNTRYLMACSALVLCCVISLVTFNSYWNIAQQARLDLTLDALNLQIKQMLNTQRVVQGWLSIMDNYLIWIVMAWFVGCIVMFMRNLLDYIMCMKLRKEGSELASPHWENTLSTLCQKVGINRKVNMRISEHLKSPCTLGYFKPLILVPVGLLSGMSQTQVEAILLHELGHIRRNDYVIGLIQVLLKIVFFFNPMTLWISSVIDAERENACDDIAVEVCKDPLFFSKTLQEFAELNNSKNLSMAINDNKMQLLTRIKRQLQKGKQFSRVIEKLVASFTLLLCCTTVAVYAQTNSPMDSSNLKEKVEAEMVKWPVFSKLPEDQRLAAVKKYLEEYDEKQFSDEISKIVNLQNDKYQSEKIDAYFYNDPLKVKLDISVDMLNAMARQNIDAISKENLVLLQNQNKNYLIVIDKHGATWKNKTLDEKLALAKSAYLKAILMNKFYAVNNMHGYDTPSRSIPEDLTFKVTSEYLFIELSSILISYAINANVTGAKNIIHKYHGKSLVPGAPFAGAEKAANGNMIITYDRKSWQQKAEWMRENNLFSNSHAALEETILIADSKKDIANAVSKLDQRRKNLLLTESQLKKISACLERNFGFPMPADFSYKLQKTLISNIEQLNDAQLIVMEESKSDRLKKYVLGRQGEEFYINLLDDSDKTPEDPEGLASCKK